MKKIKTFIKANYAQLIYIFILCVVASLLFTQIFINLFYSLKSLGLNFVYYFADFFVDAKAPQQTLSELIKHNNGVFNTLLPIDFEVFKERFLLSFKLMINLDIVTSWATSVSNTFSLILSFAIMFFNLVIIFVILLLIRRKAREKQLESADDLTPFYDATESKPLIKAKKLYIKFKNSKFLNKIKDFFKFLFSPKYVKLATWFFLAFISGLFNVCVEFLSTYLYFVTSFDFNSLWQFVIVALINVAPFLFKLPLVVHLVIAYIIVDKIRLHHAHRKLEKFESKNYDFIKETGNAVLVTGASGKGKTRTIVDMALTAETYLRDQLLEIMHDIERKFYRFNFRKLDILINEKLKSGEFIHDAEIIKYVAYQKKQYEKFNKCDLLADYDNKPLIIYDELNKESIFQALSDYIRAYCWYTLDKSMILSNVAISSSATLNDKRLFIPFSPDFFTSGVKDIEKRSLSVNFNWDWFRLGKRFSDANRFTPTFGVFAFSEIGKERGSYESNQSLKKDDINANPKNDLVGIEQRTHRHKASLRHKILFKEFFDEQRPEQLDPDLRRTFETITILEKSNMKEKLTIGAWRLERRIAEGLISLNDKLEDNKRELNFNKTLLSTIRKHFIGLVNKYYTKRLNRFKYTEIKFSVANGSVEKSSALNAVTIDTESSKKSKYYLSDKKDFADRYDSEYLINVFMKEITTSTYSMRDVQRFGSYKPTFEELDAQNSYLFETIKSIFGLKK